MSLPSRERGLKPDIDWLAGRDIWSLPSRERGLKRAMGDVLIIFGRSLPSRERGLKHTTPGETGQGDWSLPSRERGLKPGEHGGQEAVLPVAPFTGAWIETTNA